MSNEEQGEETILSKANGQRPPAGKVATVLRRFVSRAPRKAYMEALDALATVPHLADAVIDAPWIVGVHYDAPGRENYFTGVGAVIDSEWVITCAHLFSAALDMPQFGEPPTAEKNFFLRIGDSRIGVGKRHEIARKVENEFRPTVGREALRNLRDPTNDIALLRLAEPTDVEPIPLAVESVSEGDRLSCLGWPMGDKGPGLLAQVNTTVITRHACQGGMIKTGEVCAANGQAGAAMLNGYSGGPGVTFSGPDNTPVLAALVSRGADVGDDSIAPPGVLTDVTAHRDFIVRTIGPRF